MPRAASPNIQKAAAAPFFPTRYMMSVRTNNFSPESTWLLGEWNWLELGDFWKFFACLKMDENMGYIML